MISQGNDVSRPVKKPPPGLKIRKAMPRPIQSHQSHPVKGPRINRMFQPRAARTMEMKHGGPGLITPFSETESSTIAQRQGLAKPIRDHDATSTTTPAMVSRKFPTKWNANAGKTLLLLYTTNAIKRLAGRRIGRNQSWNVW